MAEPNRQSGENEERIIEIEIERLRPFKEHPFQVKDWKDIFIKRLQGAGTMVWTAVCEGNKTSSHIKTYSQIISEKAELGNGLSTQDHKILCKILP